MGHGQLVLSPNYSHEDCGDRPSSPKGLPPKHLAGNRPEGLLEWSTRRSAAVLCIPDPNWVVFNFQRLAFDSNYVRHKCDTTRITYILYLYRETLEQPVCTKIATTILKMAAAGGDRGGLDVTMTAGELQSKCWLCTTSNDMQMTSYLDSLTEECKGQGVFGAPCGDKDHGKNLSAWLTKAPTRIERVLFSKLLQSDIGTLENKNESNEIKSMLLDFVLENQNLNSFKVILDHLLDSKQTQDQTLLSLAVWKALAKEAAYEEPMIIDRAFTSLKEMRAFLVEHEGNWKKYSNRVLASGNIQLVIELVAPFVGWVDEEIWDEAYEDESDDEDWSDGDGSDSVVDE
jgi:hypothetical protein